MPNKTVRNRYHILEQIGQGGMGRVFKAYDRDQDRFVALKTIDANTREDVAERFLREAHVTARLLKHPNVIEVYEFGEDEGRLFIVMELLDGVDLRALIRSTPSLGLTDRLGLMLQICTGVGFAHSKGIVHRDLTPSNIHVLRNGHVKIMDFGLVRLASSEITRSGAILGTPSYMSPEQAEGRTVTAQSDVFSLGAVFYELLTCRKAFEGGSLLATLFQILNEDHASLVSLRPDLPELLVSVIDKALSKKREARFRDANELRNALVAVSEAPEWKSKAASSPSTILDVLEMHARLSGTEPETPAEPTIASVNEPRSADGPAQFTSLAGDLKTTSLAVLLRHAADNAKTGALHLRRGPIEKRLFFVGGLLFSTATNSPRETLGQFLIRTGYISEKQLYEALKEQGQSGQPLGTIVSAKGWVDEWLLRDLVRLKSEESIHDCFLWPDGEFAFEDGHIPDAIYMSDRLDVTHIIRESGSRVRTWKKIRKLFPSTLTTFTTKEEALQKCENRSGEERRLIELVEQGRNLAEIALELHGVEFYVASRMLDLCQRGLIEVDEVPEESSYEEKVKELRHHLRAGLTHFNAGEHDQALRAFEAAVAIDPYCKAYLYIEQIRERQGGHPAETPLLLDQTPLLAVTMRELERKTLDPKEAFVLSRVNGEWDLGAIVKICPMGEREVTGIFRKLIGEGLVKLASDRSISAAPR